jgi:hypothetical protein
MLVPNKTFLFFLCDFAGRAYFLDNQGNVQLGNINSVDYSLQDGPANWLDIELTFMRNQHYFGFNRSFSPELKFVRSGAQIIRTKLYNGQGMQTEMYFVATKWDTNTGVYKLYYQGLLDFTQITEDDPVTGITLKTIEGGIPKIIKSYENTVIEIPCDGSLDENVSIKINGIMFAATINYNVIPANITANGTVIPVSIGNEWGNDVDCEKNNQKYDIFDHNNSGSISTMEQSQNYCFLSTNALLIANEQGGLEIKGSIRFGGILTNAYLKAYFSDGSTPQQLTTPQNLGAQTLNFDITINCNAAAGVYICLLCDTSISGQVISGNIQFIFNSQFQDTFCYGIKPADVFNLILKKIFAINSLTIGHNQSYPWISNLLNSNANLIIVPGASLRGNSGAKLKISLSQFFDTFNPIKMVALGYETVVNPNQVTGPQQFINRILFENREVVYDSTNIDFDLGEVARLKIIPAEDLAISDIKIGYPEQKYDYKQGNDEFNTTAQYKTPFDKLKKELNLVSIGRADSFGIEASRFLTGTTQTSNNKSDNDFFIINIDLQSPQTDDVNITAITSQSLPSIIHFNDQSLTDNTDELISWPIIFNTITGTGFAGNFIITNGNFINPTCQNPTNFNNSKVQYDNLSSSNVNGSLIINGTIKGICFSLYIGSAFYPQFLTTGTYPFQFTIYKNGYGVQSAIIWITLGSSFNFSMLINEFQINFGDQIWIDWRLANTTLSNNMYYYGIQKILPTICTGNFTQCTLSLTTENELIYNVLRANYDIISSSTMINPKWSYNIEDLTPSRMIKAHGSWIRSVLYNMVNNSLMFQTSDKNHDLFTSLNGVNIQEGVDIPLSSLNSNILFYPYYFEFDTQIPVTFMDLMNVTRNAHGHFTYYGIDFYCFPSEVKVKPGLNESQHWKMLASPVNNLNNLINFDLSGLKLLNLQKMSTFISFFNPLKFYPASPARDARYNFRHMDSDFFIQQTSFYGQTKNYFQKWQNSDSINLQVLSSAIAPAKVQIYTDKGILYNTYTMDGIDNSIIDTYNLNNPNAPAYQLFQVKISLSSFNQGTYYAIIYVGVSPVLDTFISEGFQVSQSYATPTLYLEYSNSYNRVSTLFQGSTSYNFTPAIRVDGWLGDYLPKSHTAAFEDQPADMKILNAIDFRSHKLNIGTQDGIPPWMIDIISKIFGLDTVTIDGLAFSKFAEDSEWEVNRPLGWTKAYYTLEVRESENVGGVQAITTGSIEDELITTIFVDTLGFGESNSESNIIVLEKID